MHKLIVVCAGVGALLGSSCNKASPAKHTQLSARPRVALVVMDGFGLREPAVDNAVREALDARPNGFLARAILRNEFPNLSLGASGECVGLGPGITGNSQAGHNAICAGRPVLQRRTHVDNLMQNGGYEQAAALNEAMLDAKARGVALHLVAYLADNSSAGHWDHVIGSIQLAKKLTVTNVHLHLICDGRSDRTCPAMLADVRRVMQSTGVGAISTIFGRVACVNRQGLPSEAKECGNTMRGGSDLTPVELDSVINRIRTAPLLEASLEPTLITGGKTITTDDVVILHAYRRDVVEGLMRWLRGRPIGEPVPATGPTVVTFGLLDARARYADDPHLIDAFELAHPEALLLGRLKAAGIRQLRVAEEKKAAHVTYFCDRQLVEDDPGFMRYHPPSLSKPEGLVAPCLSTLNAVEHVLSAMSQDEIDFALMNLPNADILGHTGVHSATVEAVKCLDQHLGYFVSRATRSGWHVFITGDHGNADVMQLADGSPNVNHSNSPVPFIAVAAVGEPPLELAPLNEPACVGRTAWTVLDALGVAPGDARSLLAQ